MITKTTALSMIAIIAAATTFASYGNLFPSVYACETNAKGCNEQGGPGASFQSPPEVSGCHDFPPVATCAQSSTPPGMGLGPK